MRLFKSIFWILVTSASLILIGEALAQWLGDPSPYVLDDRLGWRLKKSFFHAYVRKDESGGTYGAVFQTDSSGLRVHGADSPSSLKVLVLGDSYTAHPFTGNSEMWYSIMSEGLAKSLGRDVFVAAAGGGGYGTYQELLLAREVSAFFRPDLVILQFCLNDFGNNHKEWEAESIVRSQYLRRPYLANAGGSEFHQGFLAGVYRSEVLGQSKVFTALDAATQLVQYKVYGGYFSPSVAENSSRYEMESLAITGRLLAELRSVFERVPYIMVNCSSSDEGPNKAWKKLAKTAGLVPVSAPLDAIDEAKRAGKIVFYSDRAHFDPLSNFIYGSALVDAAQSALRAGN